LVLAETSWPVRGFHLGGKNYKDVGLGEFTGFYDWLRSSDGRLLGVRYWPQEDNVALFEAMAQKSFAKVSEAGALDIRFVEQGVVDDASSCDQEFQYDAVFHAPDGGWAIVFDTIALSAADMVNLHSLQGSWVPVTGVER
jgi:hypothetical protein